MNKLLIIFFIAFYSSIAAQTNLKVKTNSSLTVLEGSNIDVIGNFESESSANVVLKSGASIIVSGTKTGNITYKRNLPTDEYFLVSPPVSGQSYDDTYVNDYNIDEATNINAIATYISSTNNWDWMSDGETLTFTSGVGYNVKLENNENGGELSFTGVIAGDLVTQDDGVNFTLSYDLNSSGATGYDGYNWNLVGNPYPAYIKNSDFLTNNSNIEPNIWTYNSTNPVIDNEDLGGYQVRTRDIDDLANGNFYIAPGQGFFVKSVSVGSINFPEADQYHQIEIGGSDTFQRTTPLTNIKLKVNNGTSSRKCDVYYLDDVTLGFDYGYEGPLYGGGGNANSLAIYTQLLENNEGVNYQTQSLPNTNYEGMVVPVGVDALANAEITISAELNNFPASIKVFLEDKQENTFTRLDATSNFSTTLSTDLNSTGRFYLHTTSASLSTGNVLDNNPVNIFTTTRDNLRIVGVQSGTANVQMFNILGKQVLNTSFEGSGSNNINLPVLSNGVYIVQVKNESGTINKKVVIK